MNGFIKRGWSLNKIQWVLKVVLILMFIVTTTIITIIKNNYAPTIYHKMKIFWSDKKEEEKLFHSLLSTAKV